MSQINIPCIIIEDEERTRNFLHKMLNRYCPELKVIGLAPDVGSAVQTINQKKPALIFLDVEMPDGNGFDVIDQIDDYDFEVIFVTGYNEHAIRAIKVNALDYLLKPIDTDELVLAVRKAIKRINSKALASENLNKLLEQTSNNKTLEEDKIVIHTASGIDFITIKDIVYCKADKNYTTFFLSGNKEVISSTNLGEYEKKLPNQHYSSSHRFFRSHKSYLVNLHYLTSYDSQEYKIILADNLTVPLSQRKRSEFMKILNG